jgi:hypothetical protein
MGKLRRFLILPDLHAPYHHRQAFQLVLQVARAFTWDTLIDLGDFYDMNCVSSYTKDPNQVSALKDELDKAREECLDPLNKIKFRRKIVTLGNHDIRYMDYLKEKSPGVYSLVMQDDWLGFRTSGWEVIGYRDYAQLGKLFITHECAANGAEKVLNAVQNNIVSGHDHSINYLIRGTALGDYHVSATFGWLGDIRHADYMHRLKAQRKWALGFGVGYLRDNGMVYLQPVPIVKNSCVVEGQLFTV